MFNTTRSAAANSAQANLAGIIGRVGSLFSAGLQRLYAAHTEKVQMRLAPTPIHSGRADRQQRPFGL